MGVDRGEEDMKEEDFFSFEREWVKVVEYWEDEDILEGKRGTDTGDSQRWITERKHRYRPPPSDLTSTGPLTTQSSSQKSFGGPPDSLNMGKTGLSVQDFYRHEN